MNPIDASFQKERPTLMVPRHEVLPPCDVRKSRFLMGKWGLYQEIVMPWGHLVKQLWDSPRSLPYGDVSEVDTFQVALAKIYGSDFFPAILSSAAKFAERNQEWIGMVFYDPKMGDYRYIEPSFSSTEVSLQYNAKKDKNLSLVVDIHSHGKIEPFFSDDDNADDKGAKIAIVLGNYRETKAGPRFDYRCRYCVDGFTFDLPTASSGEEKGR